MAMSKFLPRPIRFLGVEPFQGYEMKRYSITYGERAFAIGEFEAGLKLASTAMPQPAVTAERPGVGFLILHQGKTGHYLIACWWDHENELPTRVFVTDQNGWRPAQGESFCVWDLDVMWREREAYVSTLLQGKSVEEYLKCTC
ncbi:MAG: hypothetical protein U0798_12630 [Gemmataceae bacterium]